ncbi:MAG: DUF3313 domain-containing protein [Deltaproteobacteria bacterium]|nr:MAG: DUF3313 domain-containing protein [Deltaproteobacteria bacterium]TMB51658.1 MAG: DUF3313 domain-containing protein [Deltaproteobacteria bacterium]
MIRADDRVPAPTAMRRSRVLAVTLLLVAACARRTRQPAALSGFLDDYSLLRKGGPGDVALVYRDPDAHWTSYDKVLFEPVTLWRSGRKSLDPVPEGDLLRLIADLEGAVRRHLGDGFELVEEPQPGAMRIRLAITEARASDPVLDVLRARGDGDVTAGSGPLHPETRRFIESAEIEGEIRDARTNQLLAAGVDRRRPEGALPIDTWADVHRALDFWAARVCARLEARTGRPP